MSMAATRVRWGIALGGGGAPGVFAALGFLRALARGGLTPDVIVGASSGGLVAGALGAGLPVEAQVAAWEEVARDPSALLPAEAWHLAEAVRPDPAPGLISLAPVLRRVLAAAGDVPVRAWAAGAGVMVTDLTAGAAVRLDAAGAGWRTAAALEATAAFPGLIAGTRGPDGHLYVDGGLYDLIPVQACRDMGAVRVVAVRIGARPTVPPELSLAEVFQVALDRVLEGMDRSANPGPADLAATVATSGAVLTLAAWRADLRAGESAAEGVLPAIRALVGGP